ncbi:MAG: DUF2157 domain-containing protein [Ilumatobacteraceae bacterium]
MENAPFPPPTWPAPPAAPSPTGRSPEPDQPVRSWRPPPLSAAGWLATVGASLLLVASIIVVAGNWQSIDPEVRFAGLVSALVAIYSAAEAGRRRLPSTSRALATLAAALTAPVGIAAAATLGEPWPVCTLVGGVAALVATEMQSRRWDVTVLKASTVVAFGLAAVGGSALTSIPVTIIAAAGAVGALLLGSTRRTVTLSVAVGLGPVAVWLAALGFGPGTIARLGMTGDDLVWSAPVSCTIAAAVLAVVATRRTNLPLAVVALATLASGVLTSLVVGDAGTYVWWSIPAVLLLAAEAAGATSTDSIWRRMARRSAPVVAVGLGTTALLVPYGVLWTRWLFGAGLDDAGAAVPAVLTCLGLLGSAFGSARRVDDDRWRTAASLAAAAAGFGALVVGGAPLAIASLAAVAAWIAISVATPWRSWDVTTAVVASWVVFAQLVDSTFPGWARLVIVVATGVAWAISVSTVRRNDEGFRLIFGASLVGIASALVVTDGALEVGTLVFAALIALGVTLQPDRSLWPLATVSIVGLLTIDDAPTEWATVALVGVAAAAFAGSSRSVTDVRTHVAAALCTVTGALALATAGVDPGTATMAGVAVGTALSGIALLDRRLLPLLTAGTTATSLAVLAGAAASPVFASIAVTMLGAQLALAGATWRGSVAALPGSIVSVIGLVSMWWTTGTNAWAIAAIAPYGATGVDLAVGVLSAALLTAGWAVRRAQPVSTWLAYGPGLALVGTWLLASQLEPGTDWATLGALAIGVVSIGIGGWRRLGAPLVAGTIMVAGTVLLSAGARLAAAPTWAWIALGGTGLLVLAALVERSEHPLFPVGRRAEEQTSLVEQFCRTFR